MFQNHRTTLPISHVQLKAFGHTRENSPEFLRTPMARVVPGRVLAGGRRLTEHAWKLIPSARADALQNIPTHVPPTVSRNNDVRRSVPVNHGVCPGFQGVSDTVLTQRFGGLRRRLRRSDNQFPATIKRRSAAAQRRAVSLAVPAPITYGTRPGGTTRRRTDMSTVKRM